MGERETRSSRVRAIRRAPLTRLSAGHASGWASLSAPRDPSLERGPRIGLQSKLVASYLSVGLALTLLNLVAAHVLQRNASRIDASRAETARMSKELALTASSAFEEGFSFVLSGDDAEKAQCLTKLASVLVQTRALALRPGITAEELEEIRDAQASTSLATRAALTMFAAAGERDLESKVASVGSYEVAMDHLVSEASGIVDVVQKRTMMDAAAMRVRSDRSIFAVGFVAVLLGATMGVAFGRRITRPISRLGDAAHRFGRGELGVAWEVGGGDEIDVLSKSLARMAGDVRRLLGVEAELRQAQKLEAVGRLASGVAHEINTPVQFVSHSMNFLRDATKELIGVLEKLQKVQQSVLDGVPSRHAATEAAVAQDAADLPFLLENLPKAFDLALDGLARVTTILHSMKDFAHPDAKAMSAVDLNRAVESTLTIARSEYKYVADVETSFGDLPRVVCHVGEINQVVLNIAVNAAHAIGDVVRGTDRRGRISVRTWCEGGDAVIAISDTGAGIPDDARQHIFEPFFTTKEVGKGTGQGLSMARSVIVDRHHGDLSFETEVGKGTTFYIRLPVAGSPSVSPVAT
jgi:signal transduction histidine kinase